MARFPVTMRNAFGAGQEAPEMEEMLPAKPAPAEIVQDLSEALDALLGILNVVQDAGMLPEDVSRAMDELIAAAEKASAALDGVLQEASPTPTPEGEFAPAKPVLKVPVRTGDNRRSVTYARTPNYGLEEI